LLSIAGLAWIGARDHGVRLTHFLEPATVALDLGMGLLAALALAAVWELAQRRVPSARRLSQELAAAIGPLPVNEALALAALSGLGEELFFRGALQGSIGLWWATAIFAALHTGPGHSFRVWTLLAAAAGFGLGALVIWRQQLLAAIVAHAAFNAVGLVRLSRLARELGSPTREP
jgi:membrane protease YdiL (CAAX protease family)